MRKLITIMYGVDDLACSTACEMVQILVAAAYYTIPWVSLLYLITLVGLLFLGRLSRRCKIQSSNSALKEQTIKKVRY